jgi:glycosyltransferase involved in cell wall biosynthesis
MSSPVAPAVPSRPARPDAPPLAGVRVCFFNRVKDRNQLTYVSHFANDLRLLRELGCEVHIATRAHELRPADIYFVWWWTWAFQPLLLGKLLRKPVIVTGALHAHQFAERPALERRLIAFAFRHASANLFISESEQADCMRMIDVRHPHHVPLVVDTDRYAPGSAERSTSELFTVVWMTQGNGERKCVPEMLDAMALLRKQYPELRLTIAGEQADGYPVFAARARELGVDDIVTFLGVIDEEEKIRRMQHCVAYLQPTHFEGFGAAILEAMSCGAPVVTTPVGSVPQVVGECAELVRTNTAEAIAESVARVLGDPVHANTLSTTGRARAVDLYALSRRREALGLVVAELLGR